MQGTKNTAQSFGRVNAVVGLPPINVNEIYLGDSFELCERVPAKTVDLILEDMPYNTTACEWDVKIDLQLYWETRLRILKPTGVIVLTASQPFTTDLINSNRALFRYEWIWDKLRGSTFALANKMPLKTHENILIFYEALPLYNPQKSKGQPYDKTKYNGERNRSEITKDEIIIKKNKNNGDRYPTSVIVASQNWRRQEQEHPTQKPVGLFEYLIRTYTNEGDLVFDGFGGSGTTAIAAYKAKRNFIVIEKEEKYYKLATERLRNERAQCRLF